MFTPPRARSQRPAPLALAALLAAAAGCAESSGDASGPPDARAAGGATPDAAVANGGREQGGEEAGPDAAADATPTPRGDAGSAPDVDASADPGPDAAVPPSGCVPCAAGHAQVTADLHRLHFDLLMSRVEADPARYVPLVWASPEATGGDRRGLAGTLPAPGYLGVVGAGRVVAWAGHEGAFGGEGDGRVDNDAFRERLFTWLLGGGTRIGFSTGHGEWLGLDGFSPAVRGLLEGRGLSLTTVTAPLDAAALGDVDVLVVGNPWGALDDAEISAISTWVEGGGAALVLGLGWSWRGNNDDPRADRYPVQRLGRRLGFEVMDGAIFDPGAPAGTADLPAYDIRPLSAYDPLPLVVLRAAETDVARVKTLAAERPDAVYVIEGEHMGLSLPNADWAELADPAAAVSALDRIYTAELALTGGVHPPFGGDMVWAMGVDAPDAPWWMHSGNPIIFQAAAARAEIIPRLNAEGHPGWGLAHEHGHNMHISACNDLFVPSFMVEVWPNVFGLYSYRENGWDFAPQMGADLFERGHAYHAEPAPDFARLADDPFILLGCFDLLLGRYGWEGMSRFLTTAAQDAAIGVTPGDDAARIAYLVEGLSRAYGVDLAPVFAHWGFPLTERTRVTTGGLPAADL